MTANVENEAKSATVLSHSQSICEQFLCRVPASDFPWELLLNFVSDERQDQLMNRTLFHPLCKEFPLSISYQRNFCKRFIKVIEDHNEVVCEKLYNYYVSLLSEEDLPFSFKLYYLPQVRSFVPILENRNLLSHGTTGLNTWQGAIVLAEWCFANVKVLKGKRILELGSGAGFTGITTLKTCEISSYVFTDYHNEVLSLLEYNVKINFDKIKFDSTKEKLPCLYNIGSSFEPFSIRNISVKSLDWADSNSTKNILDSNGSFDIILAADVVFEPAILHDLVNTLHCLLISSAKLISNDQSCEINEYPFACFSLTVRNPSTYELFLQELKNIGLFWKELVHDINHIFHFDRSSEIKLLKISAKL